MSYSYTFLQNLLAYGAGRLINDFFLFLLLVLLEVFFERLRSDVLFLADLALELGPVQIRFLQFCGKNVVFLW